MHYARFSRVAKYLVSTCLKGLKRGRIDRNLHGSAKAESATLLLAGGLAVGGAAIAARYGLEAYNSWVSAPGPVGGAAVAGYYKGPFEDEMSRSEAAKILGVREYTDPERINKRHKKLLIINHPDRGGSTFLASKINEAKQKLVGGGD